MEYLILLIHILPRIDRNVNRQTEILMVYIRAVSYTHLDISKSNIDWKRVRAALDAAGYTGYITGEVSKTDPDMSWSGYYRMVCGEIDDIVK